MLSQMAFLRGVVSGNFYSLKMSLIGQAIIQAHGPRDVIAPQKIGLAVQLHHRQLRLALSHKELAPTQPQNLTPDFSSGPIYIYHSLCVRLQVRQWQGEDTEMSLEIWGWKIRSSQVLPVWLICLLTHNQSRIQLIRCNCSADCSTLRCSCRNNNMQCSSACGQCKGSSCTNSAITPLPPDYDSEDSEECSKCISLYGKRRGAEKVGLNSRSREYYHYEMLKKRRLFKSKCECLKCTLYVGLCSGHGSFL